MVHVSWPRSADAPYEVVVEASSVNSTGGPRPQRELERFASLTQKVVQVPKTEVDEQRAGK